jgi:CRP-like cAMP-binding protein
VESKIGEDGLDDVGLLSPALPENSRQPALFSVLDDETRQAFVAKCSRKTFAEGQSLFTQGDRHSYSYIIEDGLVRTYYVAPGGQEITLGYWSQGDLIGGPDVFGGGIHFWSAVASRQCSVLAIRGNALREFAAGHPEMSQWIIDVLRFKLRWLSILFQIHGTERVEDRVVKLLLLLADNFGEETGAGTVIRHRISQSDLGAMVGASRQWTNRTLGRLKAHGLLDLADRQIVLPDLAALRKRTGPGQA